MLFDEIMKETRRLKKNGVILLFVLIYMMIKSEVKQFMSSGLSGEDYGIVLAYFILGLFISYYGLYSLYLWKSRKTEK